MDTETEFSDPGTPATPKPASFEPASPSPLSKLSEQIHTETVAALEDGKRSRSQSEEDPFVEPLVDAGGAPRVAKLADPALEVKT